ncbi:hypothetical protein THAOC_03109 [Thalassiosira oceanica]|uniref:Uncharacterized protein n=1 Tax=Thalassiosira oceanica TaxID=159749 RepID=K0T912_THAOC|nr:hypothetical protein THAOC_03109 [Thalassiosira oceanica]|eukprot:EJK75178.1 hypothetical protein THAOC_03109 [Thalassiosira oceanica]
MTRFVNSSEDSSVPGASGWSAETSPCPRRALASTGLPSEMSNSRRSLLSLHKFLNISQQRRAQLAVRGDWRGGFGERRVPRELFFVSTSPSAPATRPDGHSETTNNPALQRLRPGRRVLHRLPRPLVVPPQDRTLGGTLPGFIFRAAAHSRTWFGWPPLKITLTLYDKTWQHRSSQHRAHFHRLCSQSCSSKSLLDRVQQTGHGTELAAGGPAFRPPPARAARWRPLSGDLGNDGGQLAALEFSQHSSCTSTPASSELTWLQSDLKGRYQ